MFLSNHSSIVLQIPEREHFQNTRLKYITAKIKNRIAILIDKYLYRRLEEMIYFHKPF